MVETPPNDHRVECFDAWMFTNTNDTMALGDSVTQRRTTNLGDHSWGQGRDSYPSFERGDNEYTLRLVVPVWLGRELLPCWGCILRGKLASRLLGSTTTVAVALFLRSCLIMRKPLLLWFALVSCALLVLGGDSAWNGKVPNANNELSSSGTLVFTPFYVPPGARAHDSASPLVLYTGTWTESFSPAYVESTLHSSPRKDSSVFFSFSGTGVEWFGNTGVRHGIANVYIDGVFAGTVDTWNNVSRRQQRLFWQYGLARGRHNIKIVNSGRRRPGSRGYFIDVDAFVVTNPDEATIAKRGSRPRSKPAARRDSGWTLTQAGSTGVNAMQLAIISDSHAMVIDKVEHNPLVINGHPAWGALYNLRTHSVKPLSMQSNSFCASGSFLGNGTMLNVGGNPVVEDFTNSTDFGDVNGIQAVRLFHPCDSEDVDSCDIFDDPSRIRLASPRWYNTVVRISDGSAMILGGSTEGGWMNNATVNNPTIEYYPPKSIMDPGIPIHSPFLASTLNSNLFPVAFSISNGYVFVAANNDAMLYDWQSNHERRLPPIPNGVRVTYPMSGTALLLPLSPETEYTSEILVCGGSAIDDTRPSWEISSQELASAQCSRIVLTEEGIARGWEVEYMPQARVMPDAVLLPTGQVVVVNGAETGIAGYGNVQSQVGYSNADRPTLTPVLYDPRAPVGQRFSSEGMPTSEIPRMYHSVATLTPNGDIMIAGSNPNLDRSEVTFGTEYRVEWLGPPYMSQERPAISSVDDDKKRLEFGQQVLIKVQPVAGSSLRGSNVQGTLLLFLLSEIH